MCDVAEWTLLHDHFAGVSSDRRLLDVIAAKRAWLGGKIDEKDLSLAEVEAEVAWREIWQAQNLRGGEPILSPYTGIVAWATHRPRTSTGPSKQGTADSEMRRIRKMLTNAITPQSDLDTEFEQRLIETFGETGMV